MLQSYSNNITFAGLLTQSLSANWDPYINNLLCVDPVKDDSLPDISIVQFQRNLKDEYSHHAGRQENETFLASTQQNRPFLSKKRLSRDTHLQFLHYVLLVMQKEEPHYRQVSSFRQAALYQLRTFGHTTTECWHDGQTKCKSNDNNKNNNSDNQQFKKGKFKANTNVAEEEQEQSAMIIDETVTDPIPVTTTKTPSIKEEEVYVFYELSDMEDIVSISENEINCPMYIECIADTGTTSHVFKQHELFDNYHPIDNIYIGGVSITKTCIYGKGIIRLQAKHNKHICPIILHDVLHIPECRHNLLSLGRWE